MNAIFVALQLSLRDIIERHWYRKPNFLLWLLLFPFSLIFLAITKIRRFCYQHNLFTRYRLPVPVVIIGNITVGGVGKTPLTKHIAQQLIAQGIKVGVILRGYKGSNKNPYVVHAHDDSATVGDEALIYARNNIPVAIGVKRHLAGMTLLADYPDIQLILADDGLQHYRLQRNYEIVVIDSMRMLGNWQVLPLGPLRESVKRLNTIDAVVVNGTIPYQLTVQLLDLPFMTIITEQKIALDKICHLPSGATIHPHTLTRKKVIAMAAIGDPERFFKFLTTILGIKLARTIIFPDHHHYTIDDVPQLDNDWIILVTEKDAIKLNQLPCPQPQTNIWTVLIKVELTSPTLLKQIAKLVNLTTSAVTTE